MNETDSGKMGSRSRLGESVVHYDTDEFVPFSINGHAFSFPSGIPHICLAHHSHAWTDFYHSHTHWSYLPGPVLVNSVER